MRFFPVAILLAFLSAPAHAEMSGADLFKTCQSEPSSCAAFIRQALKGWPDEVIDAPSLTSGKVVMYRCPQTLSDRRVAGLLVRYAIRYEIPVDDLGGRDVAVMTFAKIQPACLGSGGA